MVHKNYGGKANSLLFLQKHKFKIPPFFIIEEEQYIKFLKENDLFDQIKQLAQKKEFKEIQRKIQAAVISETLKKQIIKEFEKLNCTLVSVRSSALNEDGKTKSFAGQYNTFLNVSFEQLEEKIKLCWCSLYEENVLSYNEESNLYGMCVMIEKMIDPEYAGVVFSIDPTSDRKNYSIVEIVNGLGEKLVSGEETPTKLLVRRQTKQIDLQIGELRIDKKIIEQLEDIVLKIEELYQTNIDIEYAIKKKQIYILQARPITSLSIIPKLYRQTISRPYSLIELELYFKGEYEGIKKLTNELYYFKPLFLYNPEGKNIDIYYNEYDLEEDPRLIYLSIDQSFHRIQKYYQDIEHHIFYLKNCIQKKLKIDISEFVNRIISIYPFISLGQLAGHYDNITPRVRKLFQNFRFSYDNIIYDACNYLMQQIKKQLPKKYLKYIDFLLLEETIQQKLPAIEVLEDRKKGYILFDQLYVTTNYQEWFMKNYIMIKEEEIDNKEYIKGQIAYPGNVEGKVCKILSEEDFSKFEDGDILVTPMTVPKFVILIKKCSAIVTDEGGITCHASIIARELKIPCIVGCKNATKILNDHDRIEINGSTGYIKIRH